MQSTCFPLLKCVPWGSIGTIFRIFIKICIACFSNQLVKVSNANWTRKSMCMAKFNSPGWSMGKDVSQGSGGLYLCRSSGGMFGDGEWRGVCTSAGSYCDCLGAAYSRQSYGSCEGEMQPDPVSSERITVALQEYEEGEAVGCRKLLERMYKKLMLEELLLVLLGSETSFLWKP